MKAPFAGIGLNPNLNPHYTDHLAVICIIMGIPLLFTDDDHAARAKKQYPGLKVVVEDWENVQPDPLIRDYDVLFQSEMWPREEMYSFVQPFERKYQKKIRNVHCPHGFSDKGFWMEKCADEDITLIYGQNMIDLLKSRNVWNRMGSYVRSGNYRYQFYQKHSSFYQQTIQAAILSRFANPKLPLLIYAPTWQDAESSSSFGQAAPFLLRNLPRDEYNLLVKLHPLIEENHPIELDQITFPYREHPQIVFAEDWSVIYPLLAIADAYIGDTSSIGYDYLAFNRPMFFLNQNEKNPEQDRSAFLFQCGIEIRPREYIRLYRIIEQTLRHEPDELQEKREAIYDYTFGEQIPFELLREQIWEACQSPRPEARPAPGQKY